MLDFAALVLGPAMAVFGQPVTITPTKSIPGAAAYTATGVFSFKAVQVPIADTDLFEQSNQPELGIRLGDYRARPLQGDGIVIAQGSYVIQNVILDGQGGADLILRAVT